MKQDIIWKIPQILPIFVMKEPNFHTLIDQLYTRYYPF